jgi:hybrid cluster-associated redox disulfide protein
MLINTSFFLNPLHFSRNYATIKNAESECKTGGTQMAINKEMTIGELITTNENIAPILMRAGMHCLGCPASQGETLEEACQVHGIDCDTLVSQINEIVK